MNTMVIVAHPDLQGSRANRTLLQALREQAALDVRDLYREYPNWDIDVAREQQKLLQHDRIVFQFPFYWYSCPPLLKKWFDDVLTYGWAFGTGGDRLAGKEFMLATTVGGTEAGYRSGGDNRYTLSELFRPIERTLTRCNGTYLPAYAVYNVTEASDAYLAEMAKRYAEHLRAHVSMLVQ